uniref:Something about silencing protein 10 n=1 Tax=Lygus hesperus TaxID=30085 RepID=A0A0A9Y5B6_LYGHE
MKKKGKKGKKQRDPNADLGGPVDGYDVSESDDGLDEDSRILLDNARGRQTNDEEEEVYRVYQSSDDDDEGEEEGMEDEHEKEDENDDEGGSLGSEMDSDIEDKNKDDGLPSSKAWGSKKRDYYSTDYVDQDYLDFDDEEAALMEEREANEIQKRLLAELEGADFTLGLLESVEEKKKEIDRRAAMDPEVEKETVAKDLSKLSREELLDVLKRESPGFLELMDITKEYCKKMKKHILPMSRLCEKLKVPECPATNMLKAYKDCCSIFMMNVSFFINVKLTQVPNSDSHPVVKIIGQYLTMLRMMDNLMKEKGMLDQMKKLVKKDAKGVNLVSTAVPDSGEVQDEEITGKNRKERRKKKLMLLQKKEKLEKAIEDKEKRIRWKDEVGLSSLNKEMEKQLADKIQDLDKPQEEEEDDEEDEAEDDEEKRPITYQMMKNKGLTPKRKKDVRNPRVHNKNKFKKAVKNRRGQVREVRKELKKYGGEMSGINKFVSKSIKLK